MLHLRGQIAEFFLPFAFCTLAGIWQCCNMTCSQHVYCILLKGCKPILFLRIKSVALTIEHRKGSGVDLLEGAGKQDSIFSLSTPAGQVAWWEAPAQSCSPLPRSHLLIPTQSDAPSAVSPHHALLLLLCNSQPVSPALSCP